jgi:hypothetical protein
VSTISAHYRSLYGTPANPFERPRKLDPYDIADAANDPDDTFVPFGVTILTGEPGCGKTSFATALALSLAAQEPFAGYTPERPQHVAWFAAEEDSLDRYRLLAHRYDNAEESKLDEKLPFRTFHGRAHLDDLDNQRKFLDCLNQQKTDFAVLDPLASFTRNPAEFRDLVLTLKAIGLDYGITFLVPHWSKGSGPSGGPGVQSAASALWRISSTQKENHRLVSLERSGRAQTDTNPLHFQSNNPLHYELIEAAPAEEKLTAEQAITRALDEEPRTPEQLAEQTGCTLKSARNIIRKLVTSGIAKSQGKVNRSTAYVSS